ncbi:unnamed protein product [Effrenium voratum]|nr:unnamed protein product [Effrenium voratum]
MLPPLAAVSRGQAPKPPAPAKVTPKLSEKAANFKAAVEGGKKCLERDHMDRQKRLDFLEDSVATSPLKRELLEAEFQAREQRGVLAKFRHWSTADFQPIAVLGAGAFGTVYLVRQKEKDQYFALKQMTKVRHGKKNLKRCVYTEREVLAQARNRWFVELSATFQDADHIYMLMEFLPGGDLFRWIEVMRRFSMDETRFYMAELLEALDVLHKHGFIHRDIKFDNMVLTAQGHLKLLDFGRGTWHPWAWNLEGMTCTCTTSVNRLDHMAGMCLLALASEIYEGIEEDAFWLLAMLLEEREIDGELL